jgi:hypothetical protein
MRNRITLLSTGLLLLFALSSFAQETRTRGGWLKSRENPPVAAPAPTPKPAPKPTPKVMPKPVQAKATPTPKPAPPPVEMTQFDELPLGIGYTLFLRVMGNEFERIDPERIFRNGEEIRFLIESNREGYIYIFNQTDDNTPEMIFPNAQIQNGENRIRAHEVVWVPDGGLIAFDNTPGTEKLTILFSETPLPELPRGADLSGPDNWPTPTPLFRKVTQPTDTRQDIQIRTGQKMTSGERTRGVKLKKDDPTPDFLLINRSATDNRIIASIQLRHVSR